MCHHIIRLLVLTIVVAVCGWNGNAPSAPAKERGYCCSNGVISASDEALCLAKKGNYSPDRQKLEQRCKASAATIKTDSVVKQITGYCCRRAEVEPSTQEQCDRDKGQFTINRFEAEKVCSLTRGFCCREGDLTDSTKAVCDRNRGTFFTSNAEAKRDCKPPLGYCCESGIVNQRDKHACVRINGSFFLEQRQAEQHCLALRGSCCLAGGIKDITQQSCNSGGGQWYPSRAEAEKNCQVQSGKVGPPTAVGNLMSRPVPFPRRGQPDAGTDDAGRYDGRLPDLRLGDIGVDDRCRLIVSITNNGGPITDAAAFAESLVYITTGPDNVLQPDGRALPTIDPYGKLRKAGGTITLATDLEVVKGKITLVRLDVNDAIKESDERNNTARKSVSCEPSARAEVREAGAGINLSDVALGRVRSGGEGAQRDNLPAPVSMKEKSTLTSLGEGAAGRIAITPLASTLPIEFLSPRMNEIIRPGQDLTVRYRISTPTEAGRVEFELIGDEGIVLATATHRFEPQVIPDLAGAELEEVGTGYLGSVGDMGPAEGEPLGIGDLAFIWSLPGDLVAESTCYIRAFKGTLQGRSATMRVHEGDLLLPEATSRSGLRVAIVGTAVRHPGETVRAHVDILGTEAIGNLHDAETYRMLGQGMYLHTRSQGIDRMGIWYGPSANIVARSIDGRSITIDFPLPEPDRYSHYEETDRFVLSFIHDGIAGTSGDLFIRPASIGDSGIEVTAPASMTAWPINTSQVVSWRCFGLGDPETLSFSLDLLNGETTWSTFAGSDAVCDRSTGRCTKTVTLSGARIADLVGSGSGSSLYRASFLVKAWRGDHTGPPLGSGLSGRFAVTEPSMSVVSPAAGTIVTLYQQTTFRVLVSGGARGPFYINVYHPSLTYRPSVELVCSSCPAAAPQEATWTGTIRADEWIQAIPFHLRAGMTGFRASAYSSSEPGLVGESDEFTVRTPELTVTNPDPADVWRNGEYRHISWEINMPSTTPSEYRYVDIHLRNESTSETITIAERAYSEGIGTRVRGSYRWQVGRIIHNPGGLDDGMRGDLPSGRYTVEIHQNYPPHGYGARSSVFTIE